MGLYSKAISLHNKNKGKGLLKRTLEFINTPLKIDNNYSLSSSPYTKNSIDEISQQINLCKINMLPLAIVQISCNNLIHDIISNNKTLDLHNLKETIFSFIDHLLTDETKLIHIGAEQYLFTLYNPKSVDPKLVVHQLACALHYYINDISENISIDFHEKIRIYPSDGETAEILLKSLSS